MDNQRYFRIHVIFHQPNKINERFSKQYSKHLESGEIYLGLRLNPTNSRQSAALNSIELGLQYMDLAKEVLIKDFGEVSLHLREYQCPYDHMKSIIDTDSRMLQQFLQDYTYPDRLKHKPSRSFIQKLRNVFTG